MVTAQGPKMILAFSFSPYLPAPILSTFPKQSLLFRKDSLIHSKWNVTAKLSTLLLLMYVPSNLGQILKSKERTFHCTGSEPSEVRDCSQVNSSRDQESLRACVDTAHGRRSTGSARRSSSWPPPITQDPFHCMYFIFDSVKVLI